MIRLTKLLLAAGLIAGIVVRRHGGVWARENARCGVFPSWVFHRKISE